MNLQTLLLNRAALEPLLDLDECIAAVEAAFRAHGDGRVGRPGLLHAKAPQGEFHVKAGVMEHEGKPFFAIKINGGFFGNRVNYAMPNIQGLVLLCDADHGYPLALMDSKAITVKRTGAATAVAAKYLARPESRVVTICGCSIQGHIQLEALRRVLPVEKVFAYSRSAESRERFAAECAALGLTAVAAAELEPALAASDVCVTCTPAKAPFVRAAWVRPGTFVAAVGADSPDKQELEASLLAGATVVVDILEQCLHVGELHHAVAGGLLRADEVHAELGQVVAGHRPGRTSAEAITLFDSTGTALQDLAAAMLVYRKAVAQAAVPGFDFFAS